jgi:hypothetical protein
LGLGPDKVVPFKAPPSREGDEIIDVPKSWEELPS